MTSHTDARPRPILEPDGTPPPDDRGWRRQCTKCHDSHYSQGQALQRRPRGRCRDGQHRLHDGLPSRRRPADDYINHGHGVAHHLPVPRRPGRLPGGANTSAWASRARPATGRSTPATLPPARKAHVEPPLGGHDPGTAKAKYNLNLALQAWDSGSTSGNPLVRCLLLLPLRGTGPQPRRGGNAGCQDCHDEHARGLGVGFQPLHDPGASRRRRAPTSLPPRPTARKDRDRVDPSTTRRSWSPVTSAPATPELSTTTARASTGVCDSTECHGAAGLRPARRPSWSALRTRAAGIGDRPPAPTAPAATPKKTTSRTASSPTPTPAPTATPTRASPRRELRPLSSAACTTGTSRPARPGMGYVCDAPATSATTHNQSGLPRQLEQLERTFTVPVTNINVRFNTTVGKCQRRL